MVKYTLDKLTEELTIIEQLNNNGLIDYIDSDDLIIVFSKLVKLQTILTNVEYEENNL